MKVMYRLDKDNQIIEVGGQWDEFADANNGNSVKKKAVLGKSLFQFVRGESTRMLLDVILNRARTLKQEMSHPYRCDSPDYRRYMEMKIKPLDNGELVLLHSVLREEKVKEPIHFQFTANSKPLPLVRCSMCNRIQVKNDWVEPDIAVEQKIIPKLMKYPVIYSVCETCRRSI